MTSGQPAEPSRIETTLPPHLVDWQLPPSWQWGADGVASEFRHSQEVIDALGRSLALVSAPNPDHAAWLASEARHLAHRGHSTIPTTYHYWATFQDSRRGPGYLRRWIVGESIGSRFRRVSSGDVQLLLQVIRATGSALSYLHDSGSVAGALSDETLWITPTGRIWLLGWEWIVPLNEIPPGITPNMRDMPVPPEWENGVWAPTPATDQWQLAAICFSLLTGENPPTTAVPPVRLACPECPQVIASVLDRALLPDPAERFPSIVALLRAIDRVIGMRTLVLHSPGGEGTRAAGEDAETEESRLRWAVGDDYEVLAALGRGNFGSVWRVRDLSLGREVALKMLHPRVTHDLQSVARFRREARLAAQLSHPAIVPIYDWDSRGDVSWYTMELAEGGSVADLIARTGPRPLEEVATQIDLVLDGLAAGHAVGVIHRDLKPENILIDRYNRWEIADFGIANVTGEDNASASGTPSFAAPEQLLGETQGPAADCFAMAAIVVFVLTGEPPFGSGDAKAILARQLSGLVDLDRFPPEIAEWLKRGLSADPDERFADAGEMQAAWRGAALAERERKTSWWRHWLVGDAR
jgi:eukaryotic-like serine/threonine-protein kinase